MRLGRTSNSSRVSSTAAKPPFSFRCFNQSDVPQGCLRGWAPAVLRCVAQKLQVPQPGRRGVKRSRNESTQQVETFDAGTVQVRGRLRAANAIAERGLVCFIERNEAGLPHAPGFCIDPGQAVQQCYPVPFHVGKRRADPFVHEGGRIDRAGGR